MKLTPEEIKNAIQEHENKIKELQEELGIQELQFEIGREFLIEGTIYKIINTREDEFGIFYEVKGAFDCLDYDFETYTALELIEGILRGSFNE